MDMKARVFSLLNMAKEKAQVLRRLKQQIPFLNETKQFDGQIVGVDFGPEFLKMLQISSYEDKLRVESYCVMPVPAGAIVKDEIKESAVVASILRDMFRRTGIKAKEVAFAIPRSIAIIKSITVDSRLTKTEIESRAWIEAGRYFPDLIGDIYLDFTIVGPAAEDPSQLDLILVACRKEQIKSYLEVLDLAGLTAKIVDINSYVLERALPLAADGMESTSTVALLNLNTHLSTFIVEQGSSLIHAYDQSLDGQRLQVQIRNYVKEKGLEKADEATLLNDVGYVNVLKENLVSHLRHTVHFFYSSRPNFAIQQVVLSGDYADMPGLAAFIQREISIETVVANPFKNMLLAPQVKADELHAKAPSLMLCCGLALSKVQTL